jgi:hypothetical protein
MKKKEQPQITPGTVIRRPFVAVLFKRSRDANRFIVSGIGEDIRALFPTVVSLFIPLNSYMLRCFRLRHE